MLQYYMTENGRLQEIQAFKEGCWISMVAPVEKEIQYICEQYSLPDDVLKAALDTDERSRIEVDDNYDEEVQKLKKEIQLDSLGCKLNLLVYLAELSVQGYAISSVTEFNSNGTKPRVAYANDKNFKKIVKYYSTKEA